MLFSMISRKNHKCWTQMRKGEGGRGGGGGGGGEVGNEGEGDVEREREGGREGGFWFSNTMGRPHNNNGPS